MTGSPWGAGGVRPEPVGCTARVVDRRPVAVTLEVAGELDVAARGELDAAADVVSSLCDGLPVVLDLTGVTFADSTLARLVEQLRRVTQERDTCLRVTGARPQARRVLSVLRMDDWTVESLASPCPAAHRADVAQVCG